jgi:hypothetical protein
MNIQKIEKTILLPYTDGLTAKIVVDRVGQQCPNTGNKIIVNGSIELPTYDNKHLSPNLEFGEFLILMDERLDNLWGCTSFYDKISLCKKTKPFLSTKWRIAEQKALKYCENELQKLISMLEVRHQLLIDADKK